MYVIDARNVEATTALGGSTFPYHFPYHDVQNMAYPGCGGSLDVLYFASLPPSGVFWLVF